MASPLSSLEKLPKVYNWIKLGGEGVQSNLSVLQVSKLTWATSQRWEVAASEREQDPIVLPMPPCPPPAFCLQKNFSWRTSLIREVNTEAKENHQTGQNNSLGIKQSQGPNLVPTQGH